MLHYVCVKFAIALSKNKKTSIGGESKEKPLALVSHLLKFSILC